MSLKVSHLYKSYDKPIIQDEYYGVARPLHTVK